MAEMDPMERLDTMQDLMEQIREIQNENSKDIAVVEKVQEIIQKSSELVEKSESTNEILLDAKILHTGTQVVNSNVSSVDTDLMSFNEDKYVEGLLSYIRNRSGEIDYDKAWGVLAAEVYSMFRKSEPQSYMLGSISLNPLPPKERAKPEKSKKVAESKTKLATVSDGSQKEKEDIEGNIYEHILKCLVRCYKANNKKPVSFLEFVINPDDYWETVQNIFYFSFIVRDGYANISLNETGLPVVEPVQKSQCDDDGTSTSGDQFSFSLSKEEWRSCVKKFKISSAKIKPYQRRLE